MILVRRHDNMLVEFQVKAHCKEELKGDVITLIQGIINNPELLMIFLEEFNNRIPEMEERIKDVQNSISNSDQEQDH